jgi:hypothetical protein
LTVRRAESYRRGQEMGSKSLTGLEQANLHGKGPGPGSCGT